MRLSNRMHMVADLVMPGNVLADIGCDHGYLSVWLVREKRVSRAIAMDLREGPLAKAKESITFFHQNERIETRLSDGMDKLRPGEADCIVIAGMGGILMRDILQRGRECCALAKQLVLQPQSDPETVRSEIHNQGFYIADERACYEDGKYYVAFSCEKGEENVPYSETELKYEGYLTRQQADVRRFNKEEEMLLPQDLDYMTVDTLRIEARQKLNKVKPKSLGQASRIPGVSPGDITVLMILMEKRRRTGE